MHMDFGSWSGFLLADATGSGLLPEAIEVERVGREGTFTVDLGIIMLHDVSETDRQCAKSHHELCPETDLFECEFNVLPAISVGRANIAPTIRTLVSRALEFIFDYFEFVAIRGLVRLWGSGFDRLLDWFDLQRKILNNYTRAATKGKNHVKDFHIDGLHHPCAPE
jgi:hypothetical protein